MDWIVDRATIAGNILTVADDLLKNDGQKFLEMMEQLAERRMQREEDAPADVEDESDEDSEPESERASGLGAKPASSGSGRARGEIWIFAIDAEGANCVRAAKP